MTGDFGEIEVVDGLCRGVARGKCMWKQGRRSGQDRFVTQLCPAGCLGGAVSPHRGPGQSPGTQRIFDNLLKIG